MCYSLMNCAWIPLAIALAARNFLKQLHAIRFSFKYSTNRPLLDHFGHSGCLTLCNKNYSCLILYAYVHPKIFVVNVCFENSCWSSEHVLSPGNWWPVMLLHCNNTYGCSHSLLPRPLASSTLTSVQYCKIWAGPLYEIVTHPLSTLMQFPSKSEDFTE